LFEASKGAGDYPALKMAYPNFSAERKEKIMIYIDKRSNRTIHAGFSGIIDLRIVD
jgi:hypothetical protein